MEKHRDTRTHILQSLEKMDQLAIERNLEAHRQQ
jgi:hypothetical protein